MSRPPQSIVAYARRRWRALGLLVVLFLGSVLVVALTDRGHDPVWVQRGASAASVALAPDGSIAYTLREGDAALVALEARRAESGALVWTSPMSDTRALLRAGDGWVAVATDFPRAMAADNDTLALALQAPGNPVAVYDREGLVRAYRFSAFVNTLDARAGRVAVGTGAGEIVVLDSEGGTLLNASMPISVRSVRLNADGTRLAVGGFSIVPGDLSGLVAYFEVGEREPLAWRHDTAIGVGYVGLDEAGERVVAVEEAPPRNRVLAFGEAHGDPLWRVVADGEVSQDDAGASGGVAIAPDGSVVAVSTIRGRIRLHDGDTGRETWSYRADGTTVVDFARGAPDLLLANARVTPGGAHEALLLFHTDEEPKGARLGVLAGGLLVAYAVFAGLLLGIGYARRRRA